MKSYLLPLVKFSNETDISILKENETQFHVWEDKELERNPENPNKFILKNDTMISYLINNNGNSLLHLEYGKITDRSKKN